MISMDFFITLIMLYLNHQYIRGIKEIKSELSYQMILN